jgi:arginine/lysine/ornithine decarboxylase
LLNRLASLFEQYPYEEPTTVKNDTQCIPAPLVFDKKAKKEWLELQKSIGKICAMNCGLFPPCLPLIKVGERITAEKIALLEQATNVYGLNDGKIQVYQE